MNIVCLNGQIFDSDQICVSTLDTESVCLTFRNGDKVLLHWRDESEKREILRSIEPVPQK